MIHSLKKTKTPYPIILLILPEVTQTEDLLRLGAELHRISQLDYPFKVNADKVAINKMCRYSKLHIWKFTQYKKIIFIDVDTLIAQPLDSVFAYPEFSAVRDAGDTFNTGLFVLEPSLATWRHMLSIYFSSPSYNQGDQGFLNWYFCNRTKLALPFQYNTVCKHKSNAMWPLMKRQARMIHYTSETKPWTFFMGSHRFWRQNYEPAMFYVWSRMYRELVRELEIDVAADGAWYNLNRAGPLCEEAYQKYDQDDNNNNNNNKILVVIHRWRSIESLEATIHYYQSLDLVSTVHVYWSPRMGIVPPQLAQYRQGSRVKIVRHRYESPNNLWNPIAADGRNSPILFADDENWPEVEKVEIARETWRNNPWAMVGFFPRFHQKINHQEDTSTSSPLSPALISSLDERYQWTFNLTSLKRPRPYTLLSPSLLLLNSEYLFAYTCLLPERIHRYLDELALAEPLLLYGGADLAMNLLAQGMTGQRPIAIKSNFPDPERFSFSLANDYSLQKGKVLQMLQRFFHPGGREMLHPNSLLVSQFNKIPFKKKSMKRWNDPT